MTPQETQSYLDSFINYELNLQAIALSQFQLDRVERLLEEIGNPHKHLKCIHVAGTKGKGSTCAFAASILKQAGYKVGLYTSPHLKNYKERIRILSLEPKDFQKDEIFPDCITDQDLDNILGEIQPALEKFRHTDTYGTLTYYEVLTVVAFYYFRREKVDCVVLETGLGGRLDATNVVDSLVCGITPISLEHTQILGNTIEAIAREKAAIIKANGPMVIVSPQETEALRVIEEQCREQRTEYFMVGEDITCELIEHRLDGLIFTVGGLVEKYSHLKTSLLGKHQMINAAMAIAMTEALAPHNIRISSSAVYRGIEQAQWPGRFEVFHHVVLDCAHNPSSAQHVVNTINELLPGKKVVLVLGLSQDKDRVEICRLLNAIARDVIVTKADHPRALELSMEETKELFPSKPLTMTQNVHEAMEIAFEKARDKDIILITGSVFVVGEAREYLVRSHHAKN